MMTDDDMREIEDAIETMLNWSAETGVPDHEQQRGFDLSRANVMALIRQKLEAAQKPTTSAQPAADVAQNDAEHERAVEAWRETIAACRMEGLRTETGFSVYGMPYVVIEDAMRLMRARPAGAAAGDLLRAATTKIRNEASNNACEDYAAGLHRAVDIIEAVERAGVR